MTRNTLLEVEGMSCGSCVRHVDEALRRLPGVGSVRVELEQGQVHVEHDPSVSTAEFVEALRDAGYEAKAAG